jgi:hypothetical protein
MDITEMFPSKYLRGLDLKGPTTVTLADIKQETVYKPGVGETAVYVLYCEKASKGVILSRPLATGISEALGESNTDHWPGKRVTLYPLPMIVAGVPRVAIRARAAAQLKQPAQAETQTAPAGDK